PIISRAQRGRGASRNIADPHFPDQHRFFEMPSDLRDGLQGLSLEISIRIVETFKQIRDCIHSGPPVPRQRMERVDATSFLLELLNQKRHDFLWLPGDLSERR